MKLCDKQDEIEKENSTIEFQSSVDADFSYIFLKDKGRKPIELFMILNAASEEGNSF